MQKGQGLVEYAVVLLLIMVVIIIVVTLLSTVLTNVTETAQDIIESQPSAFEVRQQFVNECLASEQFTREECITLAGQEAR